MLFLDPSAAQRQDTGWFVPTNLSDWPVAIVRVIQFTEDPANPGFYQGGDLIQAKITSLQVLMIPEPTIAWLIGLGAFVVVVFRITARNPSRRRP